ncbi:MAG: serine/threonine-protein kinase [Polyangia bacterium]
MLQPGEHIGPYLIQQHLATGASSEVYEAILGSRERGLVALKILRADKRADALLALRMANEGLALSRIDDPGVVKLIDHGLLEDGRPYLALERLERSLAESPPLSVSHAVSLTASMAATLARLHADNIIHRDLKPQNVMLSSEGLPKLVDFGFAKLPVEGATAEAPLLPLSTESEAFFGTYEYAAPEQIVSAKHVDGRADVYALGVILFELIAGRRPFVAPKRGPLISMQLNQVPPRLSALVPGLPPTLVALVARMLAKEPENRPHAQEVAAVLASISFVPRRRGAGWLRTVPLLLITLLGPKTLRVPMETVLASDYERFETALFTSTIADAEVQLRAAREDLSALGPASPAQRARHQYKEAALAKERGWIRAAIQYYESAGTEWRTLISSQPAQAYKALSICADGIGEMEYHRGQYERALSLYEEAAHTLPRTLAAAASTRQVPSFLDYQRALVLHDRGDLAGALDALADAEGHERVLLAQAGGEAIDRWQLARVLMGRSRILLERGMVDEASALAAEAEGWARAALQLVPQDKRFRLAYLLAVERLAEVASRRGQAAGPQENASLSGLRALASEDPENGHWGHALAESLVRRAQRSQGEQRRDLARAALALMRQMAQRGQWLEDVHIRDWQAIAAELSGS